MRQRRPARQSRVTSVTFDSASANPHNGIEGLVLARADGSTEDVDFFEILFAGERILASVRTASGRVGFATVRASISDSVILEPRDRFDVIDGRLVRRPDKMDEKAHFDRCLTVNISRLFGAVADEMERRKS